MSSPPLIAVTAVPRTIETGYGPDLGDTVTAGLVQGVVDSGATPICLPIVNSKLAAEQLRAVDALVLAGGQDLSTGGEMDKDAWVDPQRDEHEITLWKEASSRGLPILGICRGLQLANVILGGTTVPDLPGHNAESSYREIVHPVEVEPGSRLAAAVGDTASIEVNTLHHQAIDRAAAPLTVTGRASDGTIESAELITPDSWFLGVQWHPELMLPMPGGQPLFDALAHAAIRLRGRR